MSVFKKLIGPLGAGGGAFLLVITTVLSNLLGWVRDAMFVRVFGTTAATDSYFKAFLIPDTLLTIFITGALLGLLIPLYIRSRQISEEEGEKTFGTFFFALNGVYAIASIVCFLFLTPLSHVLFPDTLPEQLPVLINITRILLGANFCFGLSNFLGHFLLAHKRFFSYSLAPVLYNFGIILGIYFLHGRFGIYGPAWGGLFGALLHFLNRWWDFLWSPHRFRFHIDFHNKFFHELLHGIWPKVIALTSLQVGFYVYARLGDKLLPAGSYSAFQYARNLQSFLVVLIGVSFATAIFPFLAEFAAQGKMDAFMNRFEKSLRQILFLAIPSGVGMALLASESVRFIYGISNGASATVLVLIPLSLAVPFESVQHLTVRSFHVLKSTILPMISSILFLVVLIGASILLVQKWHIGVSAFGLAYFAAFFVQFLFLQYYLTKISVPFPWKTFLPPFAKMMGSALLMTAVVLLSHQFLVNSAFLLRFFIPLALGIAVFFGAAWLLKSPELHDLPIWRWFKKPTLARDTGSNFPDLPK